MVSEQRVKWSRHLQILTTSFQNAFCQITLLNWSVTASTVGCLSSFTWWWHTLMQAVMRICIPVISEQHRRLRRRKQWNHPATHHGQYKQALGDELLSSAEAQRQSASHNPLCMAGTPGGRESQQGGIHWQQRPRWHQKHNQRVLLLSCERCSAGGEALLSLQHPRSLHSTIAHCWWDLGQTCL